MTLKDKMSNSFVSSKREKGQWLERKREELWFFEFFLERERLLSSFLANLTVGSLQD